MTYRLIATDMDGTILLNNKKLSNETVRALKVAREKGIEIVLCTGRPFANVVPYLSQLNVDCSIITNNGAVIRDKQHEISYVNYIKSSQLERVLRILANEDIYYHAGDAYMTYIDSFIKRVKVTRIFIKKRKLPFYMEWLEILRNVILSDGYRKVNFMRYVAGGGQFTSLFIHSEDEEKLRSLKLKLMEIEGIEITSSAKDNLEVLDSESTKGMALERLSESMGIAPEEIIAVGDHLNDLSMIEFAGLGVAMGNGDEEVLRVADWITRSNEEEGFSHLIKTKVLEEA